MIPNILNKVTNVCEKRHTEQPSFLISFIRLKQNRPGHPTEKSPVVCPCIYVADKVPISVILSFRLQINSICLAQNLFSVSHTLTLDYITNLFTHKDRQGQREFLPAPARYVHATSLHHHNKSEQCQHLRITELRKKRLLLADI